MRTIHYSIRFLIIFLLAALVYVGASVLFRQPIQIPMLIALLVLSIAAERMSALLEWVGPVVGTVNKKEQEQEQNRNVEYMIGNALRYHSPLVIAAVRGKKRLLLHVIARILRKSDLVFRNSPEILLILMPFTTLEQAPAAFQRLTERGVQLRDIVLTDVDMLQSLMELQKIDENDRAITTTPQELRKICLQALQIKMASVNTVNHSGSAPVIYPLFDAKAMETEREREAARKLISEALRSDPSEEGSGASSAN